MYISSSIDVVENVGKGNNCSSRSPKDSPVRENVEINSSNSRPAGEAPARVNAKSNVDRANDNQETENPRPRDICERSN